MNKKIKIIDLLNKIANGEEVPSNIKVEDKEYCLDGSTYYTVGEDDEDLFCLESYTNTLDFLKSEVEILEEIEEIGEFVDLIGMDENEEEKKAIEIIKFLQHKCMQENGIGMMTIYRVDEIANAIETILNLIEKQQKEVEELNKKFKEFMTHKE